MIAVVGEERGRQWRSRQQGEWLIYSLPRRLTKKAKEQMVNEALLAGCRNWAPTAAGAFFADSPLVPLDAQEYGLLRLPDAAVTAAGLLQLPPARCPGQVLAQTVNLCCEQTVTALAECCRDVTLVTGDRQRAQLLQQKLLRQYGLPLRLGERIEWLSSGVICSTGDRCSLVGARAGMGRIYVAQDLFEVAYPVSDGFPLSPMQAAGMLYAATRQAWLRSLAVTRILPLDK